MELESVYASSAPAGARAAPVEELSRALGALVARAQKAWPALPLSPAELIRHAAERLPADLAAARAPAALDALHAEDLLLTFACARGLPAALNEFDRLFLSGGVLRAAVARIESSPAFTDEVRQVLREKLLLGASGRPPRIAEYSGRGSLTSWVRVVAVRVALDLRPAAVQTVANDQLEEVAAVGQVEPELRYLKDRYGAAFEEATTAAFGTLDDEQCNLLRLQLVDGLRTAQIATLFHVDRSTIKRRLAACREQLLTESRRRLCEKLGLSPTEFESLAGVVQSQLNLSVERLLRR